MYPLPPLLSRLRATLNFDLASDTVARRAGQPEEIADGVLYLASDLATYVNGSELVIDGGLTAGRYQLTSAD